MTVARPLARIALACAPILAAPMAADAAEKVVPVRVESRPDGTFALLRGGSPYFVRGAAGTQHLESLKRLGGNTFRTWGVDQLAEQLDEAQRLGLTVVAGVWLAHPRHGFRYDDERAVRKQFDDARAAVRKYKDHPALLAWAMGNEMEGDGRDPKVWRAVNELAKMVHAEDPNHPAMTVIAGLGEGNVKLRMAREHCRDIDMLGVNSYGGAAGVGDHLAKEKFDRPFLLTEFGPVGFWEGPSTSWKAAIEPLPHAKAETYKTAYDRGVLGHPGRCLGSFAFLWGNKQEVTGTWFSMFLDSGERTEAVDAIVQGWTGKPLANRCPVLTALSLDGDAAKVRPRAEAKATVAVTDPEDDPLAIRWEVRTESGSHHEGGDRETTPPALAGVVERVEGKAVTLRMPDAPGAYRLFVYAYDGHGGAAAANVPFRIVP